jgi:hypothetical protein
MSQAQLLQPVESDEDSIMETFHELAQVLRLPELDWAFVHYEGETLVEGHPRLETDIDACPRWARFLGMSAFGEARESPGASWFGFNGPWTLEIVAEVR